MCGRFTQKAKPEQIEKEFKVGKLNPKLFEPRFNITPTQTVPAILETDGERIISGSKWGLIPWWAKDNKISNKLINVRAEIDCAKPIRKDFITKNYSAFGSPTILTSRRT